MAAIGLGVAGLLIAATCKYAGRPFGWRETVVFLAILSPQRFLSRWDRFGEHRPEVGMDSALKLAGYLLVFSTGFLAADVFYYNHYSVRVSPSPTGATGITDRIPWYLSHRNDFNLVFIGDSRTFCGIHPGLIDPSLGTRSDNLGQFSHWLPTQYPMIRDLAPQIPRGTTVVWSIGRLNFNPINAVQRVYPLSVGDGIRLWVWGIRAPGIVDNVLFYSRAGYLIAERGTARRSFFAIVADRDAARERLRDALMRGDSPYNDPEPVPKVQEADKRASGPYEFAWAKDNWTMDQRIDTFSINTDAGKITSSTLFTRRGSYYRIELDPGYFTGKQKEMNILRLTDAEATQWHPPPPDPAYWQLFEEILKIFKKNGIRVIVNEMDEAPFIYPNEIIRDKYLAYMHTIVARRVQEYGFSYIYTDAKKLTDEDYFDYNHLNSLGVAKFTSMLVERLRPLLISPHPAKH